MSPYVYVIFYPSCIGYIVSLIFIFPAPPVCGLFILNKLSHISLLLGIIVIQYLHPLLVACIYCIYKFTPHFSQLHSMNFGVLIWQ